MAWHSQINKCMFKKIKDQYMSFQCSLTEDSCSPWLEIRLLTSCKLYIFQLHPPREKEHICLLIKNSGKKLIDWGLSGLPYQTNQLLSWVKIMILEEHSHSMRSSVHGEGRRPGCRMVEEGWAETLRRRLSFLSAQSYSSCPGAKAFITFPASSVGLAQKFVWVFP